MFCRTVFLKIPLKFSAGLAGLRQGHEGVPSSSPSCQWEEAVCINTTSSGKEGLGYGFYIKIGKGIHVILF